MIQVLGESGPAVLLVPGGAEGVEGFFPGLPEALQEDPGCRILLYDRPGAGTSTEPGGLADAADAIHAAIAGHGPVVVIGQSLGGAVGVLLALAHPDDVAGLVLLDPTPITDATLATYVGKRTRQTVALARIPGVERLMKALLTASVRRSAKKHAMADAERFAGLKITELDLAKLGRAVEGIEEIAAGIDLDALRHIPAVVVTADRPLDDPIRRAHQRLAAALGAPLVSFEGAEHAVHLSHPAEVLEETRLVLRGVAGSEAPPRT